MSKELRSIQEALSALQDRIYQQADKAEDTYNSRSDNWQNGEKGEALQAKIDTLNSIHENLDDAIAGLLELLGDI
jgi:conjugal transfer/entry exclusion protein